MSTDFHEGDMALELAALNSFVGDYPEDAGELIAAVEVEV